MHGTDWTKIAACVGGGRTAKKCSCKIERMKVKNELTRLSS
jgi:hypothetical protein